MPTAVDEPCPAAGLIEEGRVHGALYSDPAIFKAELERIWYRTWVYIGHTSEIPRANDFAAKHLGLMPLLMVRTSSGAIRLLLNRCPHRGNELCVSTRGNQRTFTCPYHAWKFSNDGELLGYAFPDGYAVLDQGALGLAQVPRVGIYKGFVFGCMNDDAPPLDVYLGAATAAIDQLCRNSPAGEIELSAGFLQHRTQANWKFVLENECDGYHPAFVHSSIFSVADSGIGKLYGPDSPALNRDHGNGHTEIDLRPAFRQLDRPLGWFGTDESRLPAYVARMKQAYGIERAREIMVDGTPHIMIFPNLFIAEIQLFVIQPVAVDVTVQQVTALQFKDAPDLNRRMLQQTMGSVGPAGLLLADDTAMYERNQRGLRAAQPAYLYLKRGAHRERAAEQSGGRIGQVTDEVASRGIWRHYQALMG